MKNDSTFVRWVQTYLPGEAASTAPPDLQAITGDAGFRHYFRTGTEPAFIAVHAPPEQEDVPAFVTKAAAFARNGVGVPRVFAVEFEHGFMLQEDLGDSLLLPLLDDSSVDRLYGLAEQTLQAIQATPPDTRIFPPYDRALLRREMDLLPTWFLGKLLGIELTSADKDLLNRVFTLLEDEALGQPQVVVHRDYHSRNLLLTRRGTLGVVDFQDAVVGAFTYDLVSLLKDCYIRWPRSLVRRRAVAFLAPQARRLGYQGLEDRQLLTWFDMMGLQRHIKVLGIFARLWLRDGKARYLDDLPLVLHYTLEVLDQYSELAEFRDWFDQRVVPKLAGQLWYRNLNFTGENDG